MLLNSFTRSRFDMGTVSGVAYNMEVEDKYLDYTILFGKDPKALLQDYTAMTGAVPMDPETQMNVMLFQITDHARRIGEPLQIPLPGAGVRLSLPAVNMDHVDLDQVGCFDFTNPAFLAWYRERVKAVVELGVGVIKTDSPISKPQNGTPLMAMLKPPRRMEAWLFR